MEKACALRLQRDIAELKREPLEGIRVHLHGDDMHKMCLILSPRDGPFSRFHLHLEVTIPTSYPANPPKVTIQTVVPHPNVISGDYICCDILRPQNVYGAYYNGGYTPAYLLKYVFLQLLSFFSSKSIEQDYGGTENLEDYCSHRSRKVEAGIMSYKCKVCGFNTAFKALRNPEEVSSGSSSNRSSASSAGTVCGFDKLNLDCCLKIVEELPDQETVRLMQAHSGMKDIVNSFNVMIRRQLVCFYLRKTFEEGTLGVGINFVDKKAPVVVAFDLLSYEAFEEHKIRKAVCGEMFQNFLPLALSDQHFLNAEEKIRASLWSIYEIRETVRAGRTFSSARTSPDIVLRTIPTMMNMLVLSLVDGQGKEGFAIKRASEKAIQGYCLLFHLFTKLARRWENVGLEVQRRVDRFVSDRNSRSKALTPDLGELLTYFLLANVDWATLCPIFLEELLARNVMWNFRNNEKWNLEHLAYMEPAGYVSDRRLKDTFEASTTSRRLVMFQVCFFRLLRAEMFDMIEQRYGFPSEEMSTRLFKMIQEISSVKDWAGFFAVVGHSAGNDPKHVCEMLRGAILQSEKQGYHCCPYSQNELYFFRQRVEPDCPAPDGFDAAKVMSPPLNLSFNPSKRSHQWQNQPQPQYQPRPRYHHAPQHQLHPQYYQPPPPPAPRPQYQPQNHYQQQRPAHYQPPRMQYQPRAQPPRPQQRPAHYQPPYQHQPPSTQYRPQPHLRPQNQQPAQPYRPRQPAPRQQAPRNRFQALDDDGSN